MNPQFPGRFFVIGKKSYLYFIIYLQKIKKTVFLHTIFFYYFYLKTLATLNISSESEPLKIMNP